MSIPDTLFGFNIYHIIIAVLLFYIFTQKRKEMFETVDKALQAQQLIDLYNAYPDDFYNFTEKGLEVINDRNIINIDVWLKLKEAANNGTLTPGNVEMYLDGLLKK